MQQEMQFAKIVKRLDVLILLELEKGLGAKPTTVSERIARLDSLGLPPSEIAEIIGKKTNYVTASLSGRKSASSGRGRREK